MTKIDFLSQLQVELEENIPDHEVDEILEYYDSYFEQQLKSGKSEYEIVQQLGNPRLICKSILEVSNSRLKSEYEEKTEEDIVDDAIDSPKRININGILRIAAGFLSMIMFVFFLRMGMFFLFPTIFVIAVISLWRGLKKHFTSRN